MIEILDVTRVSYSEMNFFVSFYEKSYPEAANWPIALRTYVAFVHLSVVFASLKISLRFCEFRFFGAVTVAASSRG